MSIFVLVFLGLSAFCWIAATFHSKSLGACIFSIIMFLLNTLGVVFQSINL